MSRTIINNLIPWNKVVLEKLIVAQVATIFPLFYVYTTGKFITVFSEDRHWPVEMKALV
jgi:hypothetical protein